MYSNNSDPEIGAVLRRRPDAVARVRGSLHAAAVRGVVRFYQTTAGGLVFAEIHGLPTPAGPCAQPVFGFHIHSGGSCTGNADDPFADVLGHYNPESCPHPHHAGDLPPLFGNRGRALSVVLTDRFTVREILGRSVIIHAEPDDFHTQPSGDSGMKIACGEITRG